MKLRKKNPFLVAMTLASFVLVNPSALATAYYWDIDGDTTAGAGSGTPNGTWATGGTTWSTSSNGTAAAAGFTTLAADDLFFSAGVNATGAYTITLNDAQNAGSLAFQEGTATLSGTGGAITLGGAGGKITINSGAAATIGSTTNTIIGGSLGLTKLGVGTLTLNGTAVNTFTGGLNVNGGTLALNYANLGTPTDLIGSGNALSLGGGALSVTGKTASTNNQTFNGVTANSGGGQILSTNNSATILNNIALGSLTATTSGGSLLTGTSAANTTGLTITTTTDKDATGIYGGRVAFFNGTANTGYDWATTASGSSPYTLGAYSAYTTMVAGATTDTTNQRAVASLTLTGVHTHNSLKFAPTATAQTLNLGGNLLTLNSGGLLITGASFAAGPLISNGTITAGNGSGSYDLVVHQYNAGFGSGNAAGIGVNTQISAVIANNLVGGTNPVTLVKAGSGSLWLTGANTFTGGIIVNGGNLVLSGVATVLNNNAITFNANSTVVCQITMTSTGGITINNGSMVSFANNTATFTTSGAVTGAGGGITLGQAGLGATILNFNSTANTFTGPIEYRVTPNATQHGVLTVNSLADSAAVGEGNIRFGVAGTGTNDHTFNYGSGAIAPLTLNNRRIELAGAHALPKINNNSGQAFTINTDLLPSGTGTKTLTLGGTGAGSSTFAGSITNGTITTLNLSKAGTGTWTLSGNNTYNGATAITAGVLRIKNGSALGSTAAGVTQSGTSAMELDGTDGAVVVGAEAISINGGGITNLGALRNIAGNNTYGGTVTMAAQSRINSDSGTLLLDNSTAVTGGVHGLVVGGAGNVTISGAITTTTGTGGNSLGKDGAGTLSLAGANTFSGTTSVNAGTLQLDYTTQNNTKLSDTAALVLGSVTLDLKGGSHTEVVGSTTLTAGTNSRVTSSTLGSVLQMGAITRGANATIDFGASNIATTSTLNTNGIIGSWATVGGIGFATNSTNATNGPITAYAYSGAEDVPRLTPGMIANGASSNVRLIEGSGAAGDILLGAATTTINTLNQSISGGTSAAIIDPAGQTLLTNVVPVGSGAGTLTIGNGTNNGLLGTATAGGELALFNNSVNGLTINSAIADNTTASSLSKSGTGTVTLAGVNTYTGATNIIVGTLQISGAGSLGSGAYAGTIVNSGALQYSSSAAQTLSGVISGTGTLTKDTSSSVLTLTAANTFTGATTLGANAGTLDISGAGSLGSGTYAQPIAIGTGSTLKFSSSVLSANPTLSGAITGQGGLTMAPTVVNATLNLTNTGNLYSGTTAISGGRIAAGPPNLSPNTSFVITGNGTSGGQLFLNATGAVNNNFSLAGVGFSDAGPVNAGAIRFASGSSLTGVITLTGDARVGYIGGGAATISGQITGSAGIDFFAGLTANGVTNTFTLSNIGTTNDYAGNTTISVADYNGARTGGVSKLTLGAINQIPSGSGKGIVVFNGADANHIATLELNGFSTNLNGVSNIAATGANISNSPTAATPATLTIGDTNISSSFSGSITDGGATKALALTKIGTGTLTLSSSTSNFSGAINITGGTLAAASTAGTGTALGAASNARTITVGTGAFLRFDAPNVLSNNFGQTNVPTLAVTGTVNSNVYGNNALGNVNLTGGTVTATIGSATYGAFNLNGTITSTGTSLISTSDPVNAKMMLTSSGPNNVATRNIIDVVSDTLTISAPLDEVFTKESKISGLTKNGAGTLLLTGANTYSGGTELNQGVLTVGTGGTPGATTSALIVSNSNTGAGNDAILNLATAVDTTVGSLSGTIATPSGGTNTATINNGGAGRNFTVNQTTAGTYAGVIAGDGNFTLGSLSTNTLTLTGTQTYTGTTTVRAGTLKLDYATNNTSRLSNSASLTLGGGTIDLSGGTHTEVVLSTSLAAGTASRVTSSTSGSVLEMNVISPGAGATVDFAVDNIATTDTLNTNGILGTWATVGGTNWAMNATNTANGLIIAYTGYSDVARLDGTPALQIINNGSTNNVRIIEGTGSLANLTLGAAITTINSLNQSIIDGTSAATIDPAGQTLRVNSILAATGAGALTLGTGTLSTATAGGDLALNNSSANDFTINSVIANHTSASSLSKTGSGTLVLSAVNTYTGATVIGAGTLSLTGSLTGGGAITVNGSAVLSESSAGIISGASSLTLASTGTGTLSGANTHSGGTTVSAGNLILGNTVALGTGPFTLSGGNINTDGIVTTIANNNPQNWNANFTFGGASDLNVGTGAVTLNANSQVTVSANTLTVGGAIGGGFGITKAGAGTLVLNGANNHSGGLTLSGGTLVVGNASALGTGPITINGGGTNTIDSSVANLIITGNNPQNWQSSFTFTGTENLNIGTGAVTMLGNRNVNVANNTLTIGGGIGGAYNLTKSGAGDMILSGVSTYSGSTTISAGSLTINGAGSLGSGNYAGAISNTGALVYASSVAQTLSGAISGTGGTMTQNGPGTLTLTGANTYTGLTTISTGTTLLVGVGGTTGSLGTGAVQNDSSLVFNRSDYLLVSGVISGTGTLTNAGTATNTLDIGGANDYSGDTFINAGILRLRADLGAELGTGVVKVASGASYEIWAPSAATRFNPIVLNGATGVAGRPALNQDGGAGKVTLEGTITLNATSDIGIGGSSSNDMEISGVISGIGGMIVDEKGLSTTNRTLTLSGANDYTGPTTVTGGIVRLGTETALGTTAGSTTVASGAQVELDGITVTGEAATISGSGTNFAGAIQGRIGTSVWTGNITIAADGTRIGAVANASLEVSGVIDDGANDYRVMFRPADNTATLIVSGPNTYTGGTSLVGGPVEASSLNKVVGGTATSSFGAPTTAANGLLIIGTGAVGGTLRYTGAGETTDRTMQIGANANPPVTGDSGGATIENNGAAALSFSAPNFNTPTNALTGTSPTRTLTLGGTNANANTISGIIQNNQIASASTAPVALTKAGSGSWFLSGANAYSGTTTVKEGILSLSGGNATSGSIAVCDVSALNATLNITAGTYTFAATSEARIGQGSATAVTGTVNQTGGALIFGAGSGAQLLLGSNTDNLTANTGIYNLSAGSITIPAVTNRGLMICVNGNTIGKFVLSGTGLLNMTTASGGTGDGNLLIGRIDAVSTVNVTATFEQTGGTANVGSLTLGGAAANGTGGTHTLTLNGGIFSANVFARLAAGNSNAATINIGGTADVTLPEFPTARGTTTTSTINFDGGTLKPLAASATYMGGLTNAFILDGGAKFDTANGSITITQNLLTDVTSTGGGLIKDGSNTLTLTGANTYTGATTVSVGTLALVGGSQASPVTVGAGASLGFTLGSPTTSTSTFNLGAGTIKITGPATLPSYTLITASAGITGTPVLDAPVIGYELKVVGNTLVLNQTPYGSWILGFFPGETNPSIIGAGADPDNDGIANGVEMVIGGDPKLGMDTALLPTIELVTDPTGTGPISPGSYLLFTYRRSDLSVAAGVTADCETDTDLVAPWTAATGALGVVIQVDDNYATFTPPATNTDRVRVYVPRGTNTKLFGRLNVVVP